MKCERNPTGNPALEKSFDFALRIVKLYRHLSERKGVKYGANFKTFWLILLKSCFFSAKPFLTPQL